jgi:uncharacterized RDD family membrane protein YckC
MFKHNAGGADRLIRVVLGVAALAFFITNTGPLHWLGLIGIIPLATAALGWCPLYALLGMSTCPIKRP